MEGIVDLLLIEALELCLASSAACALVLLLRQPVRRVFGAGAAYLLWALLPASVIAVLLPAPEKIAAPLQLADTASVGIGQLQAIATAEPASIVPMPMMLLSIWALGAALALIALWLQQRRFKRSLGPIRARGDGLWLAQSAEGLPAVLGLRGRIVLPVDFEQRYPPEQQAVVLAHERVHAARGDVVWNALFALFAALQWFNPLLRIAQRTFRADQELACDARVLSLHPHSRRHYGEALLNSPTPRVSSPLACPAFGTHPLKERITMLSKPLPAIGRRIAGAALVLAMTVFAGSLAWAQQVPAENARKPAATATPMSSEIAPPPPQAQRLKPEIVSTPSTAAEADASFRALKPAHYPKEAIAAREEGEVLMKVRISAEGKPLDVVVDQSSGSASLDAAAVEAVSGWTFNPSRSGNRDVETWVQVPVRFSLTEPTQPPAPPAPPAPPSANANSRLEAPPAPPAPPAPAHAVPPPAAPAPPAPPKQASASYRRLQPPDYSAEAKAAGEQGTVFLQVGVGADGAVETINIRRGSGFARLDKAASDAVQQWTFNPAIENGRAVASQLTVPVRFELNPDNESPAPPADALDTIILRGG